ncbi:MAG: hypothetical protein HY512_01645 [Candidatus Aenigmarchaeota archaeon]|nr:hypothetical protein [Candidatus Aenigmarchaeota archaeon]
MGNENLEIRPTSEPESEIRYGIIMEKVCTKLRRLAMVGAFPHKAEVVNLLSSTAGLQKELTEDKNLKKETKDKLLTRVDTLNWFMGSLVDEIQEVEKLNQTAGGQATTTQQEADEFDYVG